MPWRRIVEPQLGPQLSAEELERRCVAFQSEIDAEQDRIAEIIRRRLTRPVDNVRHEEPG